jgi:TolB-like protein/DNA-binding winged helix-turn-helix (wHTH) protein/Flp pilus assembly protein TadD
MEVRQLGRALKLERIPTQILLFLIEQNGRLVTREDIAEKIWGKDVFLDTDNSINGAIRKIRQALKDDPLQPQFVQTITGRGYRFIAPVFEEPSTDSRPVQFASPQKVDPEKIQPSPAPDEIHEPTSAPKASNRRLVMLAAVCLACATALAAWIFRDKFNGNHPTHPIRSIAVLPLQNLSGDPAQEYFADGMTEELITELSRIQTLRVISHTSVMEYKGTRKHLPQIARELGVDSVLEGSVIRENDQIRVTVQLLDGPNDRHLWSQDYQRPMRGILDLQSEVARAITQQIRLELSPAQQAARNAVRPVNPEAYEAYLRGRYYLSNQFTTGQPLNQANNYFEESIRKDPGFSPAYSGLANTDMYLAFFRQAPPDIAFRQAKEALRKALDLDNTNGEAHDVLGILSWRSEWNLDAAGRELNRAIALSPSDSCAHEDRAIYLGLLGRRAEALAEIARSHQLDPGPSSNLAEASVYYQLRDFPSLVETSQRGVIANPNEWVEHYNLGIGYEGTGKLLEAITQYQKAVELSDGDQDATASLAHAYAVIGRRAAAEKILHDLTQKSQNAYISPYLIANIHAGLGDKDKAFAFLEKAYNERALELSWHIKADLRIDNLRSDPRFQDLSRRVGIPR